MSVSRTFLRLTCSLPLLLTACDGDEKPAQGDEANAKAGAAEGTDEAAAKAEPATPAANEPSAEPTVFAKEHTKQRCTALTPEFLGELFEFDPKKLDKMRPKEGKQRCNYQWTEGDELFTARIGTMWVKKNEDSAKSHYASATASKTQEEMAAEMNEVKKRAAEDDTGKTKSGKMVTETTTKAFESMTGEDGVTYEPVEGIGDEAKVSSRDGTVWVRIGNAHLIFEAYRGPNKERLMDGGRPVADIPKIMAHERKWVQSTMDQRKAASVTLARAYVPLLKELAE